MQVRPCFLVIDSEHAGSISTRKLVLETAKYNVITAYSASEAASTLEKFPAIDGVVLSAALCGDGTATLADKLAAMPKLQLIIVGDERVSAVRHLPHCRIDSFAPAKLLEKLRDLFPAATQQLLRREDELEREEQ